MIYTRLLFLPALASLVAAQSHRSLYARHDLSGQDQILQLQARGYYDDSEAFLIKVRELYLTDHDDNHFETRDPDLDENEEFLARDVYDNLDVQNLWTRDVEERWLPLHRRGIGRSMKAAGGAIKSAGSSCLGCFGKKKAQESAEVGLTGPQPGTPQTLSRTNSGSQPPSPVAPADIRTSFRTSRSQERKSRESQRMSREDSRGSYVPPYIDPMMLAFGYHHRPSIDTQASSHRWSGSNY